MSDPIYAFTTTQLGNMLEGTIQLFLEFRDQHGASEERAKNLTVVETLDGIDIERELWAQGEINKPSQVLCTAFARQLPEVRALVEALRAFKHSDGCFCEAAFAGPGTIVGHSSECCAATTALAPFEADDGT